MKEFDLTTHVTEYSYDELPARLQHIVAEARRMTYSSYAPFSNFHVGAAICLSDGAVVTGSNQENAAFPSSLCAERTAAYYAHSEHPEAKFRAIAIAARDTDGQFCENPISPCGACRQALLQYEHLAGTDIEVVLCGREKVFLIPSIKSLLPFTFTNFK